MNVVPVGKPNDYLWFSAFSLNEFMDNGMKRNLDDEFQIR